jgi:hypothetical protein
MNFDKPNHLQQQNPYHNQQSHHQQSQQQSQQQPQQQPSSSYTTHIPNNIYNVSTNHPIIPNSNEYIYYKKYVSIHSEDRDCLKYPVSSVFEIELPEDIINIYALRLVNWTFPANYNTFSLLNQNITITFVINNPYNPGANMVFNPLEQEIFECLFTSTNEQFVIVIEDGFYTPEQMVTELQNKFNTAVSFRILKCLKDKGLANLVTQFENQGGYSKFVIVYNVVGQKIWYGNKSDQFTLTNELQLLKDALTDNSSCNIRLNSGNAVLPEYESWGLPGYLGLSRCNTEAITIVNPLSGEPFSPRFYYGDVQPGDGGFWLLPYPDLSGSLVYFIESPFKINLMGPAYFYMEIAGNNCIDETSPYAVNNFTLTTNVTNGVANSAFAKIAVPTTPISQWFDRESLPYKMYWPPAERMRKLSIKLRYHNGQLVQFGVFPYSFTIEFTQLFPQQNRKATTFAFSPVRY